MSAREVNFDGLPGQTHHYAGLAFGNEASARNQYRVANPKLAALQGLMKMKALADLGYAQGVIPPHERPNLAVLRQLGFSGGDARLLAQAAKQAPQLLSAASSASAMWVANAATVSPSVDSADGRVHFTVANLNNAFHRSMEASTTAALLPPSSVMISISACMMRYRRWLNLAMKGRRTIIVSVTAMASLACSCLSMAVGRMAASARFVTRRGRRAKPVRRSPGSISWTRRERCMPGKTRPLSIAACFITMSLPSATSKPCSVTSGRSWTSPG